MAEPFLSEIRIFSFNFAPRSWAFCSGQILAINQNQALFALLGTTFGGNGQTTFALPDLRSRVPVHFGQGGGLSPYVLGQAGGTENVTLDITQMPAHIHSVSCNKTTANQLSPVNGFWGKDTNGNRPYAPAATSGHTLGVAAIPIVGGSQPHSNTQPCLVLNFCISLVGIFPSRN